MGSLFILWGNEQGGRKARTFGERIFLEGRRGSASPSPSMYLWEKKPAGSRPGEQRTQGCRAAKPSRLSLQVLPWRFLGPAYATRLLTEGHADFGGPPPRLRERAPVTRRFSF